MGVCPLCRDDPNIMQSCLYCSGLLVEGKDCEITQCGRLKLFVRNLIMNHPIRNHQKFVVEDDGV